MFINNWSRNYRDITQPAYIVASEETEEEDPEAAHLTASKIIVKISKTELKFPTPVLSKHLTVFLSPALGS